MAPYVALISAHEWESRRGEWSGGVGSATSDDNSQCTSVDGMSEASNRSTLVNVINPNNFCTDHQAGGTTDGHTSTAPLALPATAKRLHVLSKGVHGMAHGHTACGHRSMGGASTWPVDIGAWVVRVHGLWTEAWAMLVHGRPPQASL